MIIGSDWGVGEVFLSMLWFFLFILWISIAIAVFVDIFRSHDMSGWAKAIWAIVVLFFPYIGVFIYLIVRGGKMGQRAVSDAQVQDEQFRQYVQSVAPAGASRADELEKMARLHDQGVLSDAEYAAAKAKALA
jgi:hypothetical protein